ncbi:MAG: hypothetical protein U9O06_07775 [Euryarchaeota archaeon]|nr:hypothetical protein [Euryarchaeota archaeon]
MRSVALSVVFIVLLSLGASPVAAASMGAPSGNLAADSDTLGGEEIRPAIESDQTIAQLSDAASNPSTTFTVNLQSDRSANWVVTVEYELTSEAEREAFTGIAEEFESGSASGGLDVSLYENLAAQASAQTNRSMAIESVDRSSSLRGNVGTLRLSFRWTEFLAEDGEKLVFNDALKTTDESAWLASLGENQELRVTTPRGYAITSANVAFSDNTVVVEGPHTFDSEELIRITLEPSFGPSWGLLAAAVVIGVAIVGGALLLRRQKEPIDGGPRMDANGGVDTADGGDDVDEPSTPTTPDADEPSEPEEDLSLLADDERVIRLLERNGGRMRQADIVSETKWSDAKVSQLLSSMADDDEITKLRIGRENLISLPDVDALDGSRVDEDDER